MNWNCPECDKSVYMTLQHADVDDCLFTGICEDDQCECEFSVMYSMCYVEVENRPRVTEARHD